MKRILYTVDSGNIAGGQMVCFNIMMAAKNSGYEVILLSQTQGSFVNLVHDKGIKVYIVSLKRSFYFHKIPSLIKILKQERIELVHTHDSVTGNILMRTAALLAGIPVISHIHIKNYFSRNIFSRIFAKTLDNLTAGICKHIIAVSQSTKKSLVDQGYPEDKIEVVRNAVDIETLSSCFDRAALLNELGIKPNAKIFLHIGRLCPDKGQQDLLEALRFISKKRDDIYCLFAGEDIAYEGRFKEKLDNMIRAHKLKENIKMLGFRRDIDSLINISDVVVLPSYEEGLPLAALEAMKNKRPFVGYATGGIPEVIEDGKNGYLVEKGNTRKLARALTAIIENPVKAVKMGHEGFGVIKERFDFKVQMNKILKIYKDSLSD